MTTDVDGPEPNEDALIDNIIRVMQYQLARDYAPETTRRDAHPKHTGLLEATFTRAGDLPPHLRVGLFAQPRILPGLGADIQRQHQGEVRRREGRARLRHQGARRGRRQAAGQ